MNTLERAEELFTENKLTDALAVIQTLYNQALPSSDRGRALAIEVVLLEAMDRMDEAHKLVAEIMKDEGDDVAFVQAAGVQFAEMGAFPHAEIFLKNLCEIVTDDPMPWYNLAVTFGREGRYPEAISAYDRCLEIEPTFADCYFQKAECYSMMGDNGNVTATLREYLANEPGDGEAWVDLGVAQSGQGKFDDAYESFKAAAKTGYDLLDIHYNWAISAVRNRDLAQMERSIEAMQDEDPTDWRTLIARADYEECIDHTWPAWEILLEAVEDAFDAADDDEEEFEARDYVIATALRFANRNKMQEHAVELVNRIFDEALFSEEILGALLVLNGKASMRAASFQVTFKAQVEETDNVFVNSGERFIVYGVMADKPELAIEAARDFEARCSDVDWKVDSVIQLSPPDEGMLGVYWRSNLLDQPPAN